MSPGPFSGSIERLNGTGDPPNTAYHNSSLHVVGSAYKFIASSFAGAHLHNGGVMYTFDSSVNVTCSILLTIAQLIASWTHLIHH